MSGLIGLLVTLLIWVIIFGVFWVILGLVMGWLEFTEPARKIAKLLFGLIAALVFISILLGGIPAIPLGHFSRY